MPIDRKLSAGRSARPPEAERRRFPNVKGSEIPPKLGQTLCSINRTQFGRRDETWTEKKERLLTRRNSREQEEEH